ncbi:MAG TPA: HDIG domain-containing protein [Myxococcota bacterium]|nr:HDIG domain-containing protein [Myxococcota bacterium]
MAGLCAVAVVEVDSAQVDTVRAGDVASHTVRAPFDVQWVDHAAFEAARIRASEAEAPVMLVDAGLVPQTQVRLRDAAAAAREVDGTARDAVAVFQRELGVVLDARAAAPLAEAGFPDEAVEAIGRWLADAYRDRLVPADRLELPPEGRPFRVVNLGSETGDLVSGRERVRTVQGVQEAVGVIAMRDAAGAPWAGAAVAVATALVRPNLFADPERTDEARRVAEDAVSPPLVSAKRGEIVFREGDRLTDNHVAAVEAIRASTGRRSTLGGSIAIAGFLLVVIGSVHIAMRRYLRVDPEGPRNVAASGLLLVFLAFLARTVVELSHVTAPLIGPDVPPQALWPFVPVAGGAMIVRLLMGTARTVAFSVSVSVVCGLLMQLDAVWVMFFLLTSLVGGGLVNDLRERISVLRAGLITGGFGVALVLLLWAVDHALGRQGALAGAGVPWVPMVAALCGGVTSGFLVLVLVPLFELLGFVTDYRLLELASLNHPVMRQLMLRAPGTYHHSVVVGTLAEAACEAIGANSLQAKVAAYFHDIGKAMKPQYFVENQRGGVNRHNDLSPVESAKVIIGHVTEGARLAAEHRLPKPIVDNILMHHGTGLLQYFYAKAQMESEDPASVDEAGFRYPGPKPNTREAGVIMLADKVEAATRTVRNPTEANVRAMIHRVINSVMADDQFSDCPLTFREIYTIADTFTRVLMGIYHQRIDYPQTAAISLAGERPPLPEPSPQITLELDTETAQAARAHSRMWNRDDEDADYESVRNLPAGEP